MGCSGTAFPNSSAYAGYTRQSLEHLSLNLRGTNTGCNLGFRSLRSPLHSGPAFVKRLFRLQRRRELAGRLARGTANSEMCNPSAIGAAPFSFFPLPLDVLLNFPSTLANPVRYPQYIVGFFD